MRIAIVIATTGRGNLLPRVAPFWRGQTRAPDRIVVAAVGESDIGALREAAPEVEVLFTKRGLCAQRNAALDHLAGDCEIVAFLDDDYIPSRFFLAEAEAVMADPEIVVATGRLLADGINSPGIAFEDAVAMVAAYDADPAARDPGFEPLKHGYGCNMVLRVSADPDLRFDERLPLYGWQEDLDFTRRLGRRGRIIRSFTFAGVHMGTKGGRTSGVRVGYSQIANPAYLVRKRVMTVREAIRMAGGNVGKNTLLFLTPEPWMDRRGRLKGNLLAFLDALSGKLAPERVLEL